MSLKLVLLKSGETIVSDVKEIISGNEENNKIEAYLLDKPYKITSQTPIFLAEENSNLKTQDSVQVSLNPWMVLSLDDKIPIPLDWVVTIVDPIEPLKELYEENVNAENS
jgi:hypothetical protein